MMTDDEVDNFEISANAQIKRISAENTWLRHKLWKLEEKVGELDKLIDDATKKTERLKKKRAEL